MNAQENQNKNIKTLSPMLLALLSVAIGIFGGIGAVVFRGLIALFHNLFFLGILSTSYDANVHTPPSPWGPFVILVPVIGAFGVAFLVKNFAPEAKGHGVPEVMDAVFYNNGKIRPVVAVIKSLASALSIGSGGSIGREGPIIQIGSSFGSTLAQILNLPVWQRVTMIAAGAGAGIAATFNTPVGGVLFAIEIILHEVSARTLVPVAIATATGTYVGRLFFGAHPSFVIPSLETLTFTTMQPEVLISYIGLGILSGLISTAFIYSIYGMEDFFDEKIKGGYYVRHMLGMLLVGIQMYLLFVFLGHYYIDGVGYSTIQDVLSGALQSFPILLLLLGLKLLATSLTLGSGASGGVFSPALFMGVALGGAYGVAMKALFPGLIISPAAFAIVGMAGIVGGTTGAAMTAIVMIFEMTLDYNVIIPLTITVAISYEIRKILSKESIYTLKLARRGHAIPDAMRKNYHEVLQAHQIMISAISSIDASATLLELADLIQSDGNIPYFIVKDHGKVVGVVPSILLAGPLHHLDQNMLVIEIAIKDFEIVNSNAAFLDIIDKIRANHTSIVLVMDSIYSPSEDNVVGVITKDELTSSVSLTAGLFSDQP